MIRRAIMAIIFVLGALILRAEGGDPFTYVVRRVFDGTFLQNPRDTSDALLVSAPAMWSSGNVRVSLLTNGALRPASKGSSEISGIAYWNESIVVLQRIDGRIVASVYDTGLTRKLTPDVDLSEITDLEDGAVVMTSIYAVPNSATAYLHAGRFLYRLTYDNSVLRATFIERNVLSVHAGAEQGPWELTYLHATGLSMFVSITDAAGTVLNTTLVPYATNSRLCRVGKTIAVISNLENSVSSAVSVVDRQTLSVRTRTISVSSERVDLATWNGRAVAVALTTRTGRPELIAVPIYEQYEQLPSGEFISGEFGMPLRVAVQQDTAYMLFSGGMVVMLLDGTVLSRDAFTVAGTA
ncbi:MAG: hypothetical protein RLZZ273_29, partial [Bacteroidota bacterium]